MDFVRYILIAFLLFSSVVFADEYSSVRRYELYNGERPYPYYDWDSLCSARIAQAQLALGTTVTVSSCDPPPVMSGYQGEGSIVTRGTYAGNGLPWDNHYTFFFKSFCMYGGTLNTSTLMCESAPSCGPNETRNPITGQCMASCPQQGEKRIISICHVDSQNASNGTLNISIDGDNSQHTANYEGCVYNYQATDFQSDGAGGGSGCYVGDLVDGEYEVCCVYNGTSSGLPTTMPDSASLPDDSPSKPVETTDDGKCKTDSKGNEVCSTDGATPSQQCGTVNGAKVCVDTDATKPPTINDKPIDLQGKNCGWVNGVLKCVDDSHDSLTTEGCVIGSDGRKYCVNRDVKETEETTKEVAPDGTITTTKTKKNNVIGDDDDTETTTQNPDGSTSTTKSGDDGQGTSDCEKNPNTLGCIDITEGKAPTPEQIPELTVPVDLHYTPWGDGGSCPSDVTVDSIGHTFSYQPACDLATGIRPVVVAVAFITAAMILMATTIY